MEKDQPKKSSPPKPNINPQSSPFSLYDFSKSDPNDNFDLDPDNLNIDEYQEIEPDYDPTEDQLEDYLQPFASDFSNTQPFQEQVDLAENQAENEQEEFISDEIQETLNNVDFFRKKTTITTDFFILNKKINISIYDQPAILSIPIKWGEDLQEGLKGTIKLTFNFAPPNEDQANWVIFIQEQPVQEVEVEIETITSKTSQLDWLINVPATTELKFLSFYVDSTIQNQVNKFNESDDDFVKYINAFIVWVDTQLTTPSYQENGIYLRIKYELDGKDTISFLKLPIYDFENEHYELILKRLKTIILNSNNSNLIHEFSLIQSRPYKSLKKHDFHILINRLTQHILTYPIPIILKQKRFADGQIKYSIALSLRNNFHYLNSSPTLRKQNKDWAKIAQNLQKYKKSKSTEDK